MKTKSRAVTPAADHDDWPELPRAAGGGLCSAPNMHNATVVGRLCPIVCMRSQQATCSTLPGEKGAHPQCVDETHCISSFVVVQAEHKLRELRISLAMHLQLIQLVREKHGKPCADLACQIAEFDMCCDDVARLEVSIQAAKLVLLAN